LAGGGLELLGIELLEDHARRLAALLSLARSQRGKGGAHLRRLNHDARQLRAVYLALAEDARRDSVSPAAEWLLDNFHIIADALREVRTDLPPGYYRRLPKLAAGPLVGYPRVFGIAWALIAHTDSALDVQRLTRLVDAYQRVQPLTIGELWAVAITLRLLLVENLRRLSEAICTRLSAREAADDLADRALGTGARSPESAALVASLNEATWSTAFAVQLAQRLRDHDPKTTPALEWLNQRLSEQGTNTDEIVRREVRRQSETNITVRNIITSMRLISTINWAEWFESVSVVDRILRQGSAMAAMDFTTRDSYRRAIEDVAARSGLAESDVAERAIAAARQASGEVGVAADRHGDPGFHLVSEGRRKFEKSLRYRTPLRTRFLRIPVEAGIHGYIGLLAAITTTVLVSGLAALAYEGVSGWAILMFAIAGAIPASDVAMAIVNRAVAYQVGAKVLPGLELREGVPHDLRAIVVIPSMLTNETEIDRLVEQMEVHYLSNRDDNLHFALLSDWRDSPTEHATGDDALLDQAAAGVERLNEMYGPANAGPRFFLLHRRRLWNGSQGHWMGWERKRGKLHELNRLIGGATGTTFMPIGKRDPELPSGIRFVITLDSDTRLPIDAAKRLIGKLAHPLNRPLFDPRVGRVIAGHGILQPRVTPSLPIGREGSLYQRTFSGPNGLDPYAFAVSDVYQDLFEEGSYVGKGIYQVDAFEAATAGRIPENTILSHDLLEGILVRAGLVTDIEVVEEFPSRYEVAAARQHRWVRGDWQTLPWIFGFASGKGSRGLPAVGRWKLFDNLRRSLSAPATLLALLLGWLLPFNAASAWTGFIVLTLLIPPALPVLIGLFPRRAGVSIRSHLRDLGNDLTLAFLQFAFLVTFLAHQAWTMIDAVGQTLCRLFIEKRRLLEWVTAAQIAHAAQANRRRLLGQLSGSLAFTMLVAVGVVLSGGQTWLLATPFLAVWALSPLIAGWASLPPQTSGQLAIAAHNLKTLRLVGRRTWGYFEAFIDDENNHLPPDNFQETPAPLVAHRTSPTNIGLYLLSIVAARDFGWLGTLGSVERLENTFASMDKLERHRGHFFNWYDTRDLRALTPKYVSTVDSGNLAGHLIALANACSEMTAVRVISPQWKAGLEDGLHLVAEAVAGLKTEPRDARATRVDFEGEIEAGLRCLEEADDHLPSVADRLVKLAKSSARLSRLARTIADEGDDRTEALLEIVQAAEAFRTSVNTHLQDLDTLAPWARIVAAEPRVTEFHGPSGLLDALPTLEQLPVLCEAWLARLRLCDAASSAADPPTRRALADAIQQSACSARRPTSIRTACPTRPAWSGATTWRTSTRR
jgi:cyclic beta-1,2-glucan synthetase